jgi:ParB-like chromosome segregation protein Spo0J
MSPLEVRVLPIADLIPADYNPRTLSAAARRKLRHSLETFGLVEPLVWNELTGRVVGGHARLGILTELGWTTVPVSVVRLSESAERALNVVLNNREAQGRFDPDKLAELLTELEALPEAAATGFDAGTLPSLRFTPAAITEPTPVDRVEVTLVTDAAGYDRMEADLDTLIRTHDLESHVRR